MDDITSIDLYEFLEVAQTSTLKEIKKAYRKKSLTCHPDKNPDNPDAVKLFHKLSKALEILIDETARASYDKVLNARKAVQKRHNELDARRKKFKTDLEAREREAVVNNKVFTESTKSDEEKLMERINFLRREGSKQLKEEMEYIRKQLYSRFCPSATYRIKITWNVHSEGNDNVDYNVLDINTIFEKYGQINAMVMSQKKKGSALIEYASSESATNAIKETGNPKNPLKVRLLSDPNRCKSANVNSSKPNFTENANITKLPDANNDIDKFEETVFSLMKRAQERKNLEKQVINDDNSI